MTINKLVSFSATVGVLALGGLGLASAQQAPPRVAIQLATSGLTSPLTRGTSDAVLARLVLDTSGSPEAVRINSLPFTLTVGGGGQASTLEECRAYNESAPTVALSASETMTAGLNNIALDAPLTLSANTLTTITLRCDVSQNLVDGSAFTFSVNTASLVATGATTGMSAVVSVRGAPPVVFPPPSTPPPGLPPTGVGGGAMQSVSIVLGSLMLAGLGMIYARRHPKRS